MPSLMLVTLGVVFIVFWRQIAAFLYAIQRPGFRWLFGRIIDLDRLWFRRLYDTAVIGAAILMFLLAYALHFGPIGL